jgi:hypothetical protein
MIAALLLAAAASASQGRLVVMVVIDQLRYQDLLWLAPELGSKGFAGLGRAAPLRYETAVTETAPGHATLATGAYADVNGIVANHFWQGAREQEGVEDPACPVWGLKNGKSAAALRAPTVGDALKLNTAGASRVVSVSLKDRGALFLGGPSADFALWWEPDVGEMSSSKCFTPGPPPWLPQGMAEPFRDWVWTMSRPDAISRLLPQARSSVAAPAADIGPEFPHRVGQGKVDRRLYRAVFASPAGTSIALRTARAAVSALKLGESGKVDLLTLSLPAVDTVGHQFGVLSRERVDAVLRIHDELGAFLDELRSRMGTRLDVVLSSDHGLNPAEAEERRLRVTQGGTVAVDELVPRLNGAIEEAVGSRKEGWVAGLSANFLTLRAPYPPRALEVAVSLLRAEPGIYRVATAGDIDRAEPFMRHAWFPGRAGDALIVLRPLWTLKRSGAGADHGTPWNDDALVPLLVQSSRFRLRGDGPFRATQFAPTVATLLETAPPGAALDAPAVEAR